MVRQHAIRKGLVFSENEKMVSSCPDIWLSFLAKNNSIKAHQRELLEHIFGTTSPTEFARPSDTFEGDSTPVNEGEPTADTAPMCSTSPDLIDAVTEPGCC